MKRISVILAFMIFSTVFSLNGWAATNENMDKVAVALVIDNSGSMKNTDPLLNRFTSSQMVLDLLTSSDYLSIKTFSDEVQTLLPMGELNPERLATAKNSLRNVPAATGYTDYLKALTDADASLADVPEGVRKFIIFLTDGAPEIRDKTVNTTQYMEALKEKIVSIGNKGAPIYTVGFGDSNQAYLTEISDLTRGISLNGTSSDVGISFFRILQELKNRYTLLDTKVSNSKLESFQFTVDEFTSRVTVLVNDELGNGVIKMQDPDGKEIQPQFKAGLVYVYHLNENEDRKPRIYTLLTNLNGTIRAVRDTKTKLWINEPGNNAQLPFESEVTARVSQTGIPGEGAQIRVNLIKNGAPVAVNPEIKLTDSDYEIKFGGLPQTGQYIMEITLNKNNQMIAKTSSQFFLANIPVLKSNLSDPENVLIVNEAGRITASLEKSGAIVSRDLTNSEISLEAVQDKADNIVLLKDDGKTESGDLIANDGIYSGWLKPAAQGELKGVISARGEYQKQPFFLTANPVTLNVLPAGTLEIKFSESVNPESSLVNFQINNKGSYEEEVTVLAEGEAVNSVPLKIAPGAVVEQKIKLPVNTQASDLKIDFMTKYQNTKVEASSNKISFSRAGSTGGSVTPEMLMYGAAGIILLLLGLVFLKRKPNKAALVLQGKLVYNDVKNGDPVILPLQGKTPVEFSIGPVETGPNHILSQSEPSFRFTVYPIHSDKGTAVVELRCSPPGILKKDGSIMTSTLLSNGDQFEMSGLILRYEFDQAEKDGKDVLTGRL